MRIDIDVPAQRIADMFVGAIENNPMTRSWCGGADLKIDPRPIGQRQSPWYSSPALFEAPGFRIEVTEFDETGAEPDKVHVVDSGTLAAGLKIMAEKYGRHFGDMLAENDDNVTQDVFLQCVALGEVVYG